MKKRQQSTLFVGDSPASQFRQRGGVRARKTRAGSGPNSTASYAKLGPDGCWLKMFRGSFQSMLDGSLEACSGTWPRAAMMRSGIAYRRQPLVPRTSGIGSSSWPTPTAAAEAPNLGSNKKAWPRSLMEVAREGMWPTPSANETSEAPESVLRRKARPAASGQPQGGLIKLGTAVQMYPTPAAADGDRGSETYMRGNKTLLGAARWPTPRAAMPGSRKPGTGGKVLAEEVKHWPTPNTRDYKDTGENTNYEALAAKSKLAGVAGGQLNADWVSLLMGFSEDWTVVGGSAECPEQ